MYLLDSDVFMRAKNFHYPFDIVPAWWDWIEREHQAGKVFTVDACHSEVLAGGDELTEWMKQQPASFALKPLASDQPSLTAVSQWAVAAKQYRQGAASQFLSVGDYFLVSQAHSLGYTVVTHEEPAPLAQRSIKIPDACKALGVEWMSPWRMLRVEGARFGLLPQLTEVPEVPEVTRGQ